MLMQRPGELRREPVGQDLHVAGEHDQLGAAVPDQRPELASCSSLVSRVTGRWWNGMPVEIEVAHRSRRGWLETMPTISMRQLADAPAIEQVGQAVVELRDQDHHPLRGSLGSRSVQAMPKRSASGCEAVAQVLDGRARPRPDRTRRA